MKRITFIIAAIPILFGCGRNPLADFYASDSVAEVGDVIYFTNNSLDADAFEWDFGDGTYSNLFDAEHAYTVDGSYEVMLTAYSGKKKFDRAFMTVTVLPPTELEVTVIEYYDEYTVSDASVILYSSIDDWNNENNPLVEGFTNSYGRVTFTGLQSKRYYIDVWEQDHNNWQLAAEDVGWIETDVLVPNEVNYFIAYVDYSPSAMKSDGRPHKDMKVLKIEKADKRQVAEKAAAIRERIEQRKAEYPDEDTHQEPVRIEKE